MTKDLTSKDIANTDFESLFPPMLDESRLVLGCRRSDYCASKIAHAVEDCNAQVLNLNVTSKSNEMAELVIDVRVNHRNVEAITRSLARYGYEVLEAHSSDVTEDERMRSRANELLHILSL